MNKKSKKRFDFTKIFNRFLDVVEKIGNILPHPATLFALFALSIIVLSEIAAQLDLSVIHPGTQKNIVPFSLLSIKGLHMILTKMVTNFTDFAPLGTVLVAMLGIGLAESTGLIGASLKKLVLTAPARLLTFVIVLAGVMSNIASGVGYVLLVPLAAIIFKSVGRHPLAGLAAAFAGVSGGYSANLLLGTIDPLLAGISQEAAHILDPGYSVNPACNYFFMAVSTVLISFVGTWVTEKIVEPRLGEYNPGNGEEISQKHETEKDKQIDSLTSQESRGLRFSLIALILILIVILWGIIPGSGFLREADTGSILNSPLLEGIVAWIFLIAVLVSIAYGLGAKTLKSDKDIMKGMAKSMSTMGTYIVLVFFAAQFVAFFKWSNLGLIVAVKGAEALNASGMVGIPMMVMFIFVAALINLVMGSASAKWAIMAPVFIPMFMLLGYSPEFVQVVYRIGDSTTNIISPMMSYFALIVAFVEKYDRKAGIGSVIALMLPFTFVFFISWTIMLVIWMLLDIPIGPGAAIRLVP
ncbi:MAG: AbgT family transporter [Candidatus Aminicenantes bacterium]|nr:AbgT family transporter [Candidatus Aminicenantes bacterium]